MKEFLEWLAAFLRDYGAYAGMSLAIWLALMERKERQKLMDKHIEHLQRQPALLKEFVDANTRQLHRFERALVASGVALPESTDESG